MSQCVFCRNPASDSIPNGASSLPVCGQCRPSGPNESAYTIEIRRFAQREASRDRRNLKGE